MLVIKLKTAIKSAKLRMFFMQQCLSFSWKNFVAYFVAELQFYIKRYNGTSLGFEKNFFLSFLSFFFIYPNAVLWHITAGKIIL